mmetsp:Transcript_3506/g.7758  ORF Transcript_3506/g.7758 Transcript_3506/m.7758 type:complete len:131 (-) Transcript_3506:2149-2541(-)
MNALTAGGAAKQRPEEQQELRPELQGSLGRGLASLLKLSPGGVVDSSGTGTRRSGSRRGITAETLLQGGKQTIGNGQGTESAGSSPPRHWLWCCRMGLIELNAHQGKQREVNSLGRFLTGHASHEIVLNS